MKLNRSALLLGLSGVIATGVVLLLWNRGDQQVPPTIQSPQDEVPPSLTNIALTSPEGLPERAYSARSEEDSILEAVTELYDYEPVPSDADFAPLTVATKVARQHATILYATPYEAIQGSLGGARAAEVIACLQGKGSQDPLYSKITTESIPWDPVGRVICECWLAYDSYDPTDGKMEFESTLLRRHKVDSPFKVWPGSNPRLSRALNPDGKDLTKDDWEIIEFVMEDHRSRIRELILNNGLYEAQLEARLDLIEKGRYEAVPGIAFGTLESCDSRLKDAISLKVFHVIEGWAVYMVAMRGEYPELDRKSGELQDAVDLRDRELRNYIDSF